MSSVVFSSIFVRLMRLCSDYRFFIFLVGLSCDNCGMRWFYVIMLFICMKFVSNFVSSLVVMICVDSIV